MRVHWKAAMKVVLMVVMRAGCTAYVKGGWMLYLMVLSWVLSLVVLMAEKRAATNQGHTEKFQDTHLLPSKPRL